MQEYTYVCTKGTCRNIAKTINPYSPRCPMCGSIMRRKY